MTEWYDKTEDHTHHDSQYLLSAYRNTFFCDDEGQQVMCHLMTVLKNFGDTDAEKVAGMKLLDMILHNCGVVENLKIVKALSPVAKGFIIPKVIGKDNLNTE